MTNSSGSSTLRAGTGSAAGVTCIGGGIEITVGATTVATLLAVVLLDVAAGLEVSMLFFSPIFVAFATIGLLVPP